MAVDETSCVKCDTLDSDGTLDLHIPVEMAVARLYMDAVRDDNHLDVKEAHTLAVFVRQFGGQNSQVSAFLRTRMALGISMDAGAKEVFRRALENDRPNDVPLSNEVYEVVPGGLDFLVDDELYLRADGDIEGQTGIFGHSRGVGSKKTGILFTRHGSKAPHYLSTHTPEETEALNTLGPAAALDNAALVYGLDINPWNGFEHTAYAPNFYAPGEDTPEWARIGQAWSHNALDPRINLLVDVDGKEGKRGLWIFGRWISRADLGNAMMGASYSLGLADSTTIDTVVTPESLVKGLAQYVLRSGMGLRMDVWNDTHNSTGEYSAQVRNQPILGASITVRSVSPDTEQGILTWFKSKGFDTYNHGAHVKFVQAGAVWGAEVSDDWEGAPAHQQTLWNLYMVTEADGRVIKGFTAQELAEAGVALLPVSQSQGLPETMAYPRHELNDAALEAQSHPLLQAGSGEAMRYRFLVGTVLPLGIPDTTRAAFEAEAFAPHADPALIAARYPGIANAYAPEKWDAVFAPILGESRGFGAVWAL